MAAGHRSDRRAEYYAGRGNRFWTTLALVGLTSEPLLPSAFKRLLEFRIGLTDLVKGQVGNDHELQVGAADILALRAEIHMYQPRYLCFNGKRSAQLVLRRPRLEYGIQKERMGRTVLFVAPSTSLRMGVGTFPSGGISRAEYGVTSRRLTRPCSCRGPKRFGRREVCSKPGFAPASAGPRS